MIDLIFSNEDFIPVLIRRQRKGRKFWYLPVKYNAQNDLTLPHMDSLQHLCKNSTYMHGYIKISLKIKTVCFVYSM